MPPIQIGTATAKPGKMTFGYLEVLTHFDGTPERLPVVIACGRATATSRINPSSRSGSTSAKSWLTLMPRWRSDRKSVV